MLHIKIHKLAGYTYETFLLLIFDLLADSTFLFSLIGNEGKGLGRCSKILLVLLGSCKVIDRNVIPTATQMFPEYFASRNLPSRHLSTSSKTRKYKTTAIKLQVVGL